MDEDLVGPLVELCQRAGVAIIGLYQQHLAKQLPVDRKSDNSPVTAADHLAQEILREGLASIRPGWPLLSEEGFHPAWAERQRWQEYWLVDPLDGTREFILGSGEFCICVALISAGIARLGIIHAPVSGETWVGGETVLARHIDQAGFEKRLVASAPPDRAAVVITSRGGAEREDVKQWQVLLARQWPAGSSSLTQGSALKFCALASGVAQAYPRFGAFGEWDAAAGQAILEAAGGMVVDHRGGRMRYNQGETLIHQHLLAVADRAVLQAVDHAASEQPTAP